MYIDENLHNHVWKKPLPGPERLETETQGVQMKGVLSWSVGLSLCAGTSDFCPALVAVTSPVQNMFSSQYTIFHFDCKHCPASWAGIACWVTCLCVSLAWPSKFCAQRVIRLSDCNLLGLFIEEIKTNFIFYLHGQY